MKIILVLFFVALASANYDPFYFTTHEEVVFKYYADVRSETFDPEDYTSQFFLRGDLHIRNDKSGNGSVFWLKNVEISAYNGIDFHTQDQVKVWTTLPKTSEAYLIPFYVGYYESGLVDDIIFHHDAPEWIYNIQKSIAGFFQMDWSRVHTKKTVAFKTHESTIYGNCTFDYEVVPTETEFVVTKYLDPRVCEGYSYQQYGNHFPVQVKSQYDQDDHYLAGVRRTYHVSHDGTIRSIKGFSSVSTKTAGNNLNSQYLSIHQNFDFVDFLPVSEFKFTYTDFTVYQPLTFITPHVGTGYFYPDISFGSFTFEADFYIKRVRDTVYEAVDYMEYNPITTQVPDNHDIKQGQAINRIVEPLRFFTVEHFQTVYDSFTGTEERDLFARTLYLRILPTVGTYPAAAFIKSLIVSHKVQGYDAAQLLYTLGTNFILPTEKVLTDLEEFLNFANYGNAVNTAAILTYSTLVYKTFHKTHSPAVEKYIKLYYLGLQKATTYEERLMYLQGLGNIRVGSVYKLLTPIALGEQVFDTPYDRHLRIHGIWQLVNAALETKHNEFETFWTIVADRTLPVELRIAALKGVFLTGTYSEIKHIFHFIQHEKNPHFLNYYYKFIQAGEHIEHGLYPNLTHYSDATEDYYNHEPFDVNTRFFVNDVFDKETGYRMIIHGNTIANETTNQMNQFFYSVSTQYKGVFYNNFDIFVRFEGILMPLSSFFSKFYGFDATTFRKQFFEKNGEPIHVEFIFAYHGQVVLVRHFDETTIDKLLGEFVHYFNSAKYIYTYGVSYGVDSTYNIPTDFGVAAQFYTQVPFVYNIKFDPSVFSFNEGVFKSKFQGLLRIWSHSTIGIRFYNPFASATQGVRRVLAFDLNTPCNLDITYDFKHHSLKVTQDIADKTLFNTFGFKTHASTQVFVMPYNKYNILDITCHECSQYTIASNPKFRGHQDIMNYHSRLFGRHFYFGIYDYEYSQTDFFDHGFARDLVQFNFVHDFGHVPFRTFLLSFHTWLVRNSFVEHKGNFGFVFYGSPCHQYPVDEWIFTANFSRHDVHDFVGIPDYHFTVNTTVLTTHHDKPVTKFGWNVEFEHIYGRLFHDLTSHFWRHAMEANERYHFYFTREMDYNEHSIEGSYKFYYGTNYADYPVFDQFLLTTESHAQRSKEQQADYVYHDDHHTYSECQPIFPWVHNYTTTYDCILAHQSLRHYRYYFNYVHFDLLPVELQNLYKHFWHYFIVNHYPTYHSSPTKVTGKNSFSLEYVYPIAFKEPEVYAVVTFPGESYVFNKFPVSKFYWFNQMDYLYINDYTRYAREYGFHEVCEVYSSDNHFAYKLANQKTVTHFPTEKWELYAANKATNYTWAVYAQKAEHEQIAARFVVGDQWFVVRPIVEQGVEHYSHDKDRFQFTTSSDGLEYVTGVNHGLHGLRIFYVRDTLVVMVPEHGVHFSYNGYILRIGHLVDDHDFAGYCHH